MKATKDFRLYQEPTIKVVKFQVEHGFAGTQKEEDPIWGPWGPKPASPSPSSGSSSGLTASDNDNTSSFFSHGF